MRINSIAATHVVAGNVLRVSCILSHRGSRRLAFSASSSSRRERGALGGGGGDSDSRSLIDNRLAPDARALAAASVVSAGSVVFSNRWVRLVVPQPERRDVLVSHEAPFFFFFPESASDASPRKSSSWGSRSQIA